MNNVFRNISCGVYIVSSKESGCVINTLTQVNSVDPLISISLNKENYTNKIIKESNKFAVSILSESATMDLIGDFGFKSSKDQNKFLNVKFELVDNIKVLTQNVVGYIICEVKEIVDCDTHDLFIGKVIESKMLNDENVMTYNYYHKVLKGTTPLKAPSFLENNLDINENNAPKYQCIICGHIYDDEVEEVKFEDLPDNWVCPKCRVGKDKFKKIN